MEGIAILLALVILALFVVVVIFIPYGTADKGTLGWGMGLTLAACCVVSGVLWNLPPFQGWMESGLQKLGVEYKHSVPPGPDVQLPLASDVVVNGREASYKGDIPPGLRLAVWPNGNAVQGQYLAKGEKYVVPTGVSKVEIYFVRKVDLARSDSVVKEVK